jgi:spermidine synthase
MKLFHYEKPVYNQTVDGVRIQVVDRGDQRELRFGNHITQSARALNAPELLVLDYTRAMMAALLFVPKPATVLHLGLGGGSLPDNLHRHLPQVRQRVVELNPGVVEVAFRFFELPVSQRLEVLTMDGAEFLRRDTASYGLIFLDAFHANGAAPHMNGAPAFRMLAERLEPGGWLAVNTWGSDRENLAQVRTALIGVFPQLHALSVRADSNVIFFASARAQPPTAAQQKRRAQWLSQRFPLDFMALLERLRPAFAPPRRDSALGSARL